MNKRNIFLWTLYDFANSIVMIVFFLYFSQWLVVDHNVSDFWYNIFFVFSTVLLVLYAPPLAAMSDASGKRLSFLRNNTILVWILYTSLSLVTLFASDRVVLAAILFIVGNFTYQLSFVFYHPILTQLAPENRRGFVSGIGQSANWLGQIVGLLLVLPLINGSIYLFGEPGRAQVFLPVTIIFILLSIPMIFFFKEKASENTLTPTDLTYEFRNYGKRIKEILSFPGIWLFVLAFFFFNDAILTASNNFPIYLERVFAIADTTKTYLLAGILATSAIGSILFGWISDKIGLKKSMQIILVGFIVVFPTLGLLTDFKIFVIVTVVMGLLYGGIWTVSRAFLSTLIPKDKLNYGFSFYTISERFASFLGPVTWGIIVSSVSPENSLNYRVAIICMAIFVIIGLFLIRRIEIKPK